MENLQGIISKSVNNATIQFEKLGYIATNVANYNTYGYKGVRFENYLKENGRLEGTLMSDHQPGSLYMTKQDLNIGLTGAGYIPVTTKTGETAYTRDGSFTVNKDGTLVTLTGDVVGKGITIPPNYSKLKIQKNGDISVRIHQDSEPQIVGKIDLVNFNNAQGLKQVDGNKYLATEESGDPMLLEDHDYIRQGYLERSNVDLHASINEVLQLNASMIASTRLIKVVDEIYRQSINLRQ